MTLVGFDTALAVTTACVVRADGRTFCTSPASAERLLQPPRHSQELLPELERLMGEAAASWQSIASVAVGVGPGTFTGLRIGIATARALAQGLGVGVRPVSSLEALAYTLLEGGLSASRLLPLIDARRRQVFAALYVVEGSDLEQLWEPMVLDPTELLARIRRLDAAPVCAGDWAIKSRAELEEAGATVAALDSGLHGIDGRALCRLAGSVEPVPPHTVEPVYLRLPDAEINKRIARESLR